ncbi:MAG: DUF3558 family protein [Acidimicrobiia bacterium]|nr:DUF3558 family protein [Acidimicrobiia bacterium]
MVRVRWIVLMCVGVVLVVSACSGKPSTEGETTTTLSSGTTADSSNPGATEHDPCELLSVDEIDAATGVSFGDAEFNETLSSEVAQICDWIGQEDGIATVQVLVGTFGVSGFDDTRSATEEAMGAVQDASVPGAARAFATTDGSIVGMDLDGQYVQVAYIPSEPGNVLPATLDMAGHVADRYLR